MKEEGNMAQLKEQNRSPYTNPKETEICELSDTQNNCLKKA